MDGSYTNMDTLAAVTLFLCCVRVANKTGECIYTSVVAVMKALGILFNKMAGLCTDGDSAMVGEEQGLSARLKDFAPMLFSVHSLKDEE